MKKIQLQGSIPDSMANLRLDQALAQIFPDFSRARLQQWVKSGELLLDGQKRRPRDKVLGGEQVSLDAELADQHASCEPEAISLDIVYEDDHLLVLNKPTNLVVHPAAGNPSGTLMNALLHHCPDLAALPRAGIVHRLDKNTTGLMVVAKTLEAHHHLVDELQERNIKREYETVVHGVMTAGGTIDAPIGRHPVDRKRMAVVASGKPAVTHYRVIKRYRMHTWVRVQLETGRTHQIRVHMAHKHYPIVGDPVYGGRLRMPPQATEQLENTLRGFSRQALHAVRLELPHPETGESIAWESPLPPDMQGLLAALDQDLQHADV